MQTNELDFHLPPELIAQQAQTDRDMSRLMVLGRPSGSIEHHHFTNIIDFFQPGDCLVINDTSVIPARFYLKRDTGGRIEGLFLNIDDNGNWRVLLKNASRLKSQESLTMINPHPQNQPLTDIKLKITENLTQGKFLIQPPSEQSHLDILQSFGQTPLPPYIRRPDPNKTNNADRNRYQTIYAQTPGSVAAPTAGLHFTEDLLNRLRKKPISIARVTLHVGLGTFLPITVDNLQDHQMHQEQYHLSQENANIINRTIDQGKRVIAVGTTSVRTLETLARNGRAHPDQGWTDIFITPGYQFKIVSAIITNFHLPRSTLLALVCAFAGTERTLAAYNLAVQKKYRFYSYGDAMLIL